MIYTALYYFVAGFVVSTILGMFHRKLTGFNFIFIDKHYFDSFEFVLYMILWPMIILDIIFLLLGSTLRFIDYLFTNYVTYITNIIK